MHLLKKLCDFLKIYTWKSVLIICQGMEALFMLFWGMLHLLTVDTFPEVLMGWYYYCFLYTLNAHNFFSLPPFLGFCMVLILV